MAKNGQTEKSEAKNNEIEDDDDKLLEQAIGKLPTMKVNRILTVYIYFRRE